MKSLYRFTKLFFEKRSDVVFDGVNGLSDVTLLKFHLHFFRLKIGKGYELDSRPQIFPNTKINLGLIRKMILRKSLTKYYSIIYQLIYFNTCLQNLISYQNYGLEVMLFIQIRLNLQTCSYRRKWWAVVYYSTWRWIWDVGFTAARDFETNLSQNFITWGWEKKDSKNNYIPLPAPALSKFKWKPTSKICIYCDNSTPLYHYRFQSCIQPQTMYPFVNDTIKFFTKLEIDKLDYFRYKPYSFFDNSIADFITNKIPNLKHSNTNNFKKTISKCYIFVVNHPGSSLLEAIAMNAPTIIFFDPLTWIMNDDAQEAFNQLQKVGIYHKTPKSAASLINKIFKDVNGWWQKPFRQRVIKKFCRTYASNSSNWQNIWISFIKEQLK